MTAALPAVMTVPTPSPTAAKPAAESGGDDFEQLLAGLTPSAAGPVTAVSGKAGGDRDGAPRDEPREQPGTDPTAELLAAGLLGTPPAASATPVVVAALSTAGAGTVSPADTVSPAAGTVSPPAAGAVSPPAAGAVSPAAAGAVSPAAAGAVSPAAAGDAGPGPSSSPSPTPTAGQAGPAPQPPSPGAPPGAPGRAGAAGSPAPFGPQLDSASQPARAARSGQPATDGRPQVQLPSPATSPSGQPTGPTTAGGTAHPAPARPASVDALAATPAAPAPDPAAAASTAAATQPVPAPAPAAPPIAAPPPPATHPVPGVGLQLAGAINRIAQSNGGHEVTLRLKPERLGSVAISVRVEDSRVQLDLRCAQPETVSAVHTALTELRAELATTGFSAVSVNVQSETAGDRQAQDRPMPPGLRDVPRERSPADQTARPHRPRPTAGGVDLFL